MDRMKSARGKMTKSHHPVEGTLIALGKSSRAGASGTSQASAESEGKKVSKSGGSISKLSSIDFLSSTSSSKASSSSGSDKKREFPGTSTSNISKKAKVSVQSSKSSSSTSTKPHHSGKSRKDKDGKSHHSKSDDSGDALEYSTEKFCVELDKAEKNNDTERINNLAFSAIKKLKTQKDKPDLKLCITLLLLSKTHPSAFQRGGHLDVFIDLIQSKKEPKIKNNPLVPLVINILCNVYQSSYAWPVQLVQIWMEDASTERSWVDLPQCKQFIDNLLQSFRTKLPQRDYAGSDSFGLNSGGSSPLALSHETSAFQDDILRIIDENKSDIGPNYRYTGNESQVETVVIDFAQSIIHKRMSDMPRNLMKSLSASCGLQGVRNFVATKIEQWLHNPKIGKQAQELLLHLASNVDSQNSEDADIAMYLSSKIKLKTKPLINFYCFALRELVRENDSNLSYIMNQVVYNELSPTKNSYNLPLLGSIFQAFSDARSVLAEIFTDLLQKREDFFPAMRLLLREIVRACRHECDLSAFVQRLVHYREIAWRDNETRERAFSAIADLILLSMFLALSPSVREAALIRGDTKDINILSNFQQVISLIQQDGVYWLHSVAIKMFRPPKNKFCIAMNKILLKDPMTDLITKDNWPPESEKGLFARLSLETTLTESTLLWVLRIGISKDHPLNPAETIDMAEQLITRAASHKSSVSVEKLEIIDHLFRLTEYKHPDNICLPVTYAPPSLTISKLYWKVWALLCVLAAHNPTTFGKIGWENYPTLKVFIEMCMTNHFTFPSPGMEDKKDEIIAKEFQTSAMEKEQILEYETHLAAASSKAVITEKTSLLLSQLIRMDPFGPCRTPPVFMLTHLQHLNESLQLGILFCRSRNPDFLLDLIQRNPHPMPWLSELVSEGSFEILPVQCLCEFMIGQIHKVLAAKTQKGKSSQDTTKSLKKHKISGLSAAEPLSREDIRSLQLLDHLQGLIYAAAEEVTASEILEYFFRRLSYPTIQCREKALKALELLLNRDTEPDCNWLLDILPTLGFFGDSKEMLTHCLRKALLVETEPEYICKYLEFLSPWGQFGKDYDNFILDVAMLIVDRTLVTDALMTGCPESFIPLLDIFWNYTVKIRKPGQASYTWSEDHNKVLVQWNAENLAATLDVHIAQGISYLLAAYVTISSNNSEMKRKTSEWARVERQFQQLLDIWAPKMEANIPKAYLLSTSEEAEIYTASIRLKMINSNNSRLISAAIHEVPVQQLLYFVQCFGIPVQAMTALLYCLDKVSLQKPESLISEESMIEISHVRNILKVQWQRGASGGENFDSLLKSRDKTIVASNISSESNLEDLLGPRKAFKIETSEVVKQKKSTIQKPLLLSPELKVPKIKTEPMECSPSVITEDISSQPDDVKALSKKLLALCSPPRRRQSEPGTEIKPSSAIVPSASVEPYNRRHSSYLEPSTPSSSDETVATEGGSRSNVALGELVDSMTLAEPCIIRNAPEFQLPLLFGRCDDAFAQRASCRSYLMTVLAHQAGWNTVESCLNLFLKKFDSSFEPGTVLDLVAATAFNPKLWQGYDKHVPKHQSNGSIYHLSCDQLLAMAEYIVEEISQEEIRSTRFSITNLLGPSTQNADGMTSKKLKSNLQSRVEMWLKHCDHDRETIISVISSLMEKKGKSPYTRKMVVQTYIEFPAVINVSNWKPKQDELSFLNEDVPCYLDSIAHNLITAIARVQPGRDFAKHASHEYDICLRKLASLHPSVLIRQLPLMRTFLEGRIHLDYNAFHQLNHQVPFSVFLGVVDCMQPLVLSFFDALRPLLALYLKLFRKFAYQKDYGASVNRFSSILNNLLSINYGKTCEFLGPHYSMLRELSGWKYYSEASGLHHVLSQLLPSAKGVAHNQPANKETNSDFSTDYLDAYTAALRLTSSLVDRLTGASNYDEMLPILQEIDTVAARNPAILNQFVQHLNNLLVCENCGCRSIAFSIILRHMSSNPKCSSAYVESVMKVLEDTNSNTKDVLLERIHEFIILAQENAEDLLIKLFELGISSNTHTLPSITKSLNLFRHYTTITAT